jgi:hypothetical protein
VGVEDVRVIGKGATAPLAWHAPDDIACRALAALRVRLTGAAASIDAKVRATCVYRTPVPHPQLSRLRLGPWRNRIARRAEGSLPTEVRTDPAITEPYPAIRVSFAGSAGLEALFVGEEGRRARWRALLAATTHPERNETTEKKQGPHSLNAHLLEPFPCAKSEPRSPAPRSPWPMAAWAPCSPAPLPPALPRRRTAPRARGRSRAGSWCSMRRWSPGRRA